ncbi:MAG TPA: 16S rRNA (cytosine(1402)-N(4))-methyltransferase RsmH [Chloroflexota bacterium]
MSEVSRHIPVLLDEWLGLIQPRPGHRYIDCTLGGSGYTAALLERSGPDGEVLALDADPDAVERARDPLAGYGDRAHLVHASFRHLQDVAVAAGFSAVDGIVMDLGFSSLQLEDRQRGFAFSSDGPLDMRFDRTQGQTCSELLARATPETLERTLREFGEETRARRIAGAIVAARRTKPLCTTQDLVQVITQAVGGARGRIHPATRTFQALRIAVNDELAALAEAVPQAVSLLRQGARLAIVSFHSLEDRIVKQTFARLAGKPEATPRGLPPASTLSPAQIRILTQRPLRPSLEEQRANPRSRSARLRAAERL